MDLITWSSLPKALIWSNTCNAALKQPAANRKPDQQIINMIKNTRPGHNSLGVIFMEEIKRSRKSKIKKRPEDWEKMKVEIAKELGLLPKVQDNGWAGLSAAESGQLGGIFAARKKALSEDAAGQASDQVSMDEILDVGTAKDDTGKNNAEKTLGEQ